MKNMSTDQLIETIMIRPTVKLIPTEQNTGLTKTLRRRGDVAAELAGVEGRLEVVNGQVVLRMRPRYQPIAGPTTEPLPVDGVDVAETLLHQIVCFDVG